MLETLWRTAAGRLAEVPLRRCSAVDTSQYLHHILRECFYKGLPLKLDNRVSKEPHSSLSELREYRTNVAASLSKKTINQRKINGTLEAMAKSARSHKTLELISGENETVGNATLRGGSSFPLIIHS